MGLDNFEQIAREEIRNHYAFDEMAREAVQAVKDQMQAIFELVGNHMNIISGDILGAVRDIRSSVDSIVR